MEILCKFYQVQQDCYLFFCAANDAAEHSVKFGSDFTQTMTKSEEARQNILQTVELARRAFPRATRKCMLQVNAASSTLDLMKAARYDAREHNNHK